MFTYPASDPTSLDDYIEHVFTIVLESAPLHVVDCTSRWCAPGCLTKSAQVLS